MQIRIIEQGTQNEMSTQEYETRAMAGEIIAVSSIITDNIEKLTFRQATSQEKQQFLDSKAFEEKMNSEEWIAQQNKLSKLKDELTQLCQDIVQDMFGQAVPNLEERKKQARELHNEIRQLEGKAPRELKGG